VNRTAYSNLMQSAATRRNRHLAAARSFKRLLADLPKLTERHQLLDRWERATGLRDQGRDHMLDTTDELRAYIAASIPSWIAHRVKMARNQQRDWLGYRRANVAAKQLDGLRALNAYSSLLGGQ
jgi:hypothetical protein